MVRYAMPADGGDDGEAYFSDESDFYGKLCSICDTTTNLIFRRQREDQAEAREESS